jgi:RNA-binding protein Musashi
MYGEPNLTLFVGGLPPDIEQAELLAYFQQFGQASVDLKVDPTTGKSRGFGFVSFAEQYSKDAVMADPSIHQIREKWIDVKSYDKGSLKGSAAARNAADGKGGGGMFPAKGFGGAPPVPVPKGFLPTPAPRPVQSASGGGKDPNKAQTLFVGGLPPDVTTPELHQYFEQFGKIFHAVVKTDAMTGKPRGFGFVEYVDQESTKNALALAGVHTLREKWIDVKVYNAASEAGQPKGPGMGMGMQVGKGPAAGMQPGKGYGGAPSIPMPSAAPGAQRFQPY